MILRPVSPQSPSGPPTTKLPVGLTRKSDDFFGIHPSGSAEATASLGDQVVQLPYDRLRRTGRGADAEKRERDDWHPSLVQCRYTGQCRQPLLAGRGKHLDLLAVILLHGTYGRNDVKVQPSGHDLLYGRRR